MKLSLTLLLEHLGLSEGNYEISDSPDFRFERICLYHKSLHTWHGSTLYISDRLPSSMPAEDVQVGFVLVNISDAKWDAPDRPYLRIRDDTDLFELFNRISLIFTDIQDQINGIQAMVSRQADLQELIEKIFDILGSPAYLVDSSFKALAIDRRKDMRELSATWRRVEDDGYLPLSLISELVSSRELERMESGTSADIIHSPYFYVPFINCNLKYKGEIQGHLFVVQMAKPLSQGDVELTEMIGQIVLQSMLNNIKYQRKRGYLYEHFMRDLFSGKIEDKSYIRDQASYLNLENARQFAIAKLIPDKSDALTLEHLTSQLERYTDVRAARYEGHIMGLFLIHDPVAPDSFLRGIRKVGKSFHCRIGVSDLFSQITEAPVHAIQAANAVTFGQSIPRYPNIVHYRDIALMDLLNLSKTDRAVFCAPEIRQLQEHDREHGTQYAATLLTYLLNERNVMETSEALHIHRNTLSYRIERMQEFFHLQLEIPAYRYRYLLSLFTV